MVKLAQDVTRNLAAGFKPEEQTGLKTKPDSSSHH